MTAWPTRHRRTWDRGLGHRTSVTTKSFSALLYRRTRSRAISSDGRLVAYAERVEAERHHGITYLSQDLTRLDDLGDAFDAVVANMVFLDIDDWKAGLTSSR
jgi:hypothetical protein